MSRGLLVLAAVMALSADPAAAAGSGNVVNDNLLAMSPDQQAITLTQGIKGCVGESPFQMGVTASGKAQGYAYWSVRCKDGRSYFVEITPAAKARVTARDCRLLEGTGTECFKKF
jgi:hypothetical protein